MTFSTRSRSVPITDRAFARRCGWPPALAVGPCLILLRTVLKTLWNLFSSLKLTVALMAFALLLVFFGTLDQVNFGIRHTQDLYFESFFVVVPVFDLLIGALKLPRIAILQHLALPLPGGFLLGGLFLVNLLCAHFRYFRASWRKTGIALIHAGLVLLIISAFISSFRQRESYMWIDEGSRTNYSEDFYLNELVVIDKSDGGTDRVYSFGEEAIRSGAALGHPELPFTVRVEAEFTNAALMPRGRVPMLAQNPDLLAIGRQGEPLLTRAGTAELRGVGAIQDLVAMERRPTYKQDERNVRAAFVRVTAPGEGPLGTWLVANVFDERFPSQVFEYADRTWELALRFKRYYKDYALFLEDFRFDRYPGTEIPKNFSSSVRIEDPAIDGARPALIYMNHPLRYEGLTFYQASYDQNTEESTMLQVVRNEGWLLPYIAVLIVGIGLAVQFGLSLIQASRRRNRQSEKARIQTV